MRRATRELGRDEHRIQGSRSPIQRRLKSNVGTQLPRTSLSAFRVPIRPWNWRLIPCRAVVMADSLVNLGLQDGIQYVHVNILPARARRARRRASSHRRDVRLVRVEPRAHRLIVGAAWSARAAAAVAAERFVYPAVDPFVYDKAREYVDIGKRRRLFEATARTTAEASLPTVPRSQLREDPLAERRAAAVAAATATTHPVPRTLPSTPARPRGRARLRRRRPVDARATSRVSSRLLGLARRADPPRSTRFLGAPATA